MPSMVLGLGYSEKQNVRPLLREFPLKQLFRRKKKSKESKLQCFPPLHSLTMLSQRWCGTWLGTWTGGLDIGIPVPPLTGHNSFASSITSMCGSFLVYKIGKLDPTAWICYEA